MFLVIHVSGLRLGVGVWEDRAVLARLRKKLQTEDGRLVLRIEQEEWKVTSPQVDLMLRHGGISILFFCLLPLFLLQMLPDCLVQLSQVHEWQIHRTGLQKIPHCISSFQNLLVLDLSRNGVTEIPKQIGQYVPCLSPTSFHSHLRIVLWSLSL